MTRDTVRNIRIRPMICLYTALISNRYFRSPVRVSLPFYIAAIVLYLERQKVATADPVISARRANPLASADPGAVAGKGQQTRDGFHRSTSILVLDGKRRLLIGIDFYLIVRPAVSQCKRSRPCPAP